MTGGTFMPRRGGRHYVLIKGAEEAMQRFKMEIAEDLGLAHKIKNGDFNNLTPKEIGMIGGEMVRRINAMGQYLIKQRYENKEERLLPPELLPNPEQIRDITNAGNPAPPIREGGDMM